MKKSSTVLLEELASDTRRILVNFEHLRVLQPEVLTAVPPGEGWTVAQILEHLNSYNRYYHPAIESAIEAAPNSAPVVFKAGWLGDYFTRTMLPNKKGQVANKMQSPKDHRPDREIDLQKVFAEFEQGMQFQLELLHRSAVKDLNGIRIPISLTKLIKLKLGDTFRFLVAHQQRHLVQIENTLKKLETLHPGIEQFAV